MFEAIETGIFKLLNKGLDTYQSHHGDCKNMLDLHFTVQSVIKFCDTCYVSYNFGSDHISAITTLNIVILNRSDLRGKVNFRKFKRIVRQENDNSVLYPSIYSKAEELNHFNQVLV